MSPSMLRHGKGLTVTASVHTKQETKFLANVWWQTSNKHMKMGEAGERECTQHLALVCARPWDFSQHYFKIKNKPKNWFWTVSWTLICRRQQSRQLAVESGEAERSSRALRRREALLTRWRHKVGDTQLPSGSGNHITMLPSSLGGYVLAGRTTKFWFCMTEITMWGNVNKSHHISHRLPCIPVLYMKWGVACNLQVSTIYFKQCTCPVNSF